MKKILIWNTFPLKNAGGPSGYNYNIKEYTKRHPDIQITFLSDIVKEPVYTNPPIAIKSSQKSVWRKLVNGIKYRKGILLNFISGSYNKPFIGLPENFNINKYDIVHLHFSMHTYRFRHTFPHFEGKIVVTSHQPCASVDELLDTTQYKWLRFFRHWGLKQEGRSYDGADYIMFPCKEAREPYEKEIILRRAFQRNESKFIYVPSSVLDITVNETSMQKFSEIGIPDNAFVITYFGRHNLVKGYDILKIVGRKLLDKYPDLYFLCAGKGDISPISHPRWIELGFINNVDELLWQSNLYILPNRDTYFDLITLEILRSGTHIILSTTGGNRFFETLPKDETEGMDFFEIDDINSLVAKVETHIRQYMTDPVGYKAIDCKNRDLFLRRFTMDSFMRNYLNAFERI